MVKLNNERIASLILLFTAFYIIPTAKKIHTSSLEITYLMRTFNWLLEKNKIIPSENFCILKHQKTVAVYIVLLNKHTSKHEAHDGRTLTILTHV